MKKNPYKVLMLVENMPVPADRRVWSEAIALRDAGLQVCIICPKGATHYRETHIRLEGIEIYRYHMPMLNIKYLNYLVEYSLALLMTFWLSIKVLTRHGFDVLHAANPPDMFFLIGLFYQLFGKKFIFDQHDLAPEMFQVKFNGRAKLLYRLLLRFERCSYRIANKVIVTNLSQKLQAIRRGDCRAAKVVVVRNGPDPKRLKPVPPEPALKQGRCYLLAYIGVMGQQDGVEYALHALHDLVHQRARQDVSLVLMGNGDHVATLKRLAQSLDIERYVNFTGWIENTDIVRYLSTADIGLSPDPQNGLNEHCTMIKTMEYMAMEKPIVAFDLAETRFSAQDSALYAIPNQVKDFADKIEILLADEALRLRLGKLGRRRIEEQLSWQYSNEQLLLVYQQLLPGWRAARNEVKIQEEKLLEV